MTSGGGFFFDSHCIFSGLQRCCWQYGSIFIRLAIVASQICEIREILQNFELIAVQGYPRSSILVQVESIYAASY